MARRYIVFIEILIIGSLTVAYVLLSHQRESRAQTAPAPKLFITWQARGYAPPQYKGKILPTLGSQITVAFDVISNGKVADLSKQQISWYLNGQMLASGKGIQMITFLAPKNNLGDLDISFELPDYPPSGRLLLGALKIPVANPQLVIETPYPEGVFGGYSPQIKGVPYFFNVPSLSYLNFSWSVNGEAVQNREDPANLTINLNQDARSGSTIYAKLIVSDPGNELSAVKAEKVLTFQR